MGQSALPLFKALRVFISRCTIGTAPLDVTAAMRLSVLTGGLTAAAWSRVLTELVSSGLLAFHFEKLREGAPCGVGEGRAVQRREGAPWEGGTSGQPCQTLGRRAANDRGQQHEVDGGGEEPGAGEVLSDHEHHVDGAD